MLKTFFLNSTLADYGEEEFNYIQKFLLQQGILNTQGADYNDFIDLQVIQHGAGDMSVDVKIGTAVIDTTRSSVNFKVFVSNLALANLVITPNTSGLDRVDAVILKLSQTTEPNALMNNVATLEVVPGDGATALSDGDIQTAIGATYDFIRLADVTVSDGETAILTADIADTRIRCYNTDATVPNPTIIKFRQLSADPATPLEGEMWYNTTANILRYYDGASVINIQASTYTGGNGINVTAGVVSVDLFATFPGLEFSGGKLKAKVGTAEGDLVQLLSGGKLPAVSGENLTGLTRILTSSANLKYSADTERSVQYGSGNYQKVKEILIRQGGVVSVSFDLKFTASSGGYGRIYVNGVAVGTERLSNSDSAYHTYTEDIAVKPFDLVQLYFKGPNGSSMTCYVRNFRISYDKNSTIIDGVVNQD